MVEALEVAAAAVVTAGLVAGNLFLFSPLRSDNRVKDQPSMSQTLVMKHSGSMSTEITRSDLSMVITGKQDAPSLPK